MDVQKANTELTEGLHALTRDFKKFVAEQNVEWK